VLLLSELLWAAFGINHPSGDRTAPYWRHVMVIDLYLALADGVRFYESKGQTYVFTWTTISASTPVTRTLWELLRLT
jgi:hypothetical protein